MRHECHECGYVVDRDIASAQEICNRGEETYRGIPEKQEMGSQVLLSGNLVLDKWRNLSKDSRGGQDPLVIMEARVVCDSIKVGRMSLFIILDRLI